jgi:FAD/FMN-containing dehydrogenase
MDVTELREAITGDVLLPTDAGFDEARGLWNVRFDRSPDVIVRCMDESDVGAAIRRARDHDLAVSVKAGGHSYAARSVLDGGLLIDLSAMQAIEIDLESSTATIGPGVTGAHLDAATQVHGLAVPTPTVSSVGVIGAALGGGGGYLSRAFGLTLDSVLAADVVTADGRSVRASADENPDLFWAIRGGGGNFGIVTSLDVRLHPVGPMVLSGQVIYPFDHAGSLLRRFRDVMSTAPDEFQCYPFCFKVPPIDLFPTETHGQPVVDFVLFHHDPEAEAIVQPLRDLGEPILDLVGPAPYFDAQKAFDANLPKGQRYLSKAHDLPDLSDGAIDTMVEFVPKMSGEFTAAYFDPLGGAVGRVGGADTAFAGRDAPYGFHIIAGWIDPSADDSVIGWANDFHGAMASYATGGVYVNLIGDDELDRVPDAYSSSYGRLRDLKTTWDPENVFRSNYNIPPA